MKKLTILEKNTTVIQLKWDTNELATNIDNIPRMEFTIKYIVENEKRAVS